MPILGDDDQSAALLGALLGAGGRRSGGLLGGGLMQPQVSPEQAYMGAIQSSPFYQGVPSQSGPFGQIAQALMPLIQATQAEKQAQEANAMRDFLIKAEMASLEAEKKYRAAKEAREEKRLTFEERRLDLDAFSTASEVQARAAQATRDEQRLGIDRQKLGVEQGKLAVLERDAARKERLLNETLTILRGDSSAPGGGGGLGYGQSVTLGPMTMRGPSYPTTAENMMVLDSIARGDSPEEAFRRVTQAQLAQPTTAEKEAEAAARAAGAPAHPPERPMTSSEIVAKSANTVAELSGDPRKTRTQPFNSLTPPVFSAHHAPAPWQTPVMEFDLSPGDPDNPDAPVAPKVKGTISVGSLSNEQLENMVRQKQVGQRSRPMDRVLYVDEKGAPIKLGDVIRGPTGRAATDREKIIASLQNRVPNATERGDIATAVTAIADLNEVISLFDKSFTGPVEGRLSGMKAGVMDLPRAQAEFRALYGQFRQQRLSELLGAARTIPELRDLSRSGALPEFSAPDLNFLTGLIAARNQILRGLENKMAVLGASGILAPYEAQR